MTSRDRRLDGSVELKQANAYGDTREEALASLREAVQMVLDEDGVPPELAETLDLEVA